MTATPQRSRPAFPTGGRPTPLEGRRATSQNELLRLARGWCREQGYHEASARLRDLAPDPLPPSAAAALSRTLGLRPGAQPDAVLSALTQASAELPSASERRALREALNTVLESLFP